MFFIYLCIKRCSIYTTDCGQGIPVPPARGPPVGEGSLLVRGRHAHLRQHGVQRLQADGGHQQRDSQINHSDELSYL